MKVLIYNIHNGGEEHEGHADRLPMIASVVTDASPDIVCLLEADNWDTNGRLEQFSALIDFPAYHLGVSNTRHHLAVLAKQESFINHIGSENNGFWHSVTDIHFVYQNIECQLLLMHLDPYNEDRRLVELENMRSTFNLELPTIITGDLNALSPHDASHYQDLLPQLQNIGLTKFGTDALRYDVIARLEQWGFTDAVSASLKKGEPFHTVPTSMNRDATHAAWLRLDYVFVNRSIASLPYHAEILRSPIIERAADHYPLLFTLS